MNLFQRIYEQIVGDPSEYRKKHSTKVKFSQYYQFRDNDIHDRQLCTFFVHGEPIMAYSKKDAIKRWVHRDLKNRRKKHHVS